MAEPRPHDVLFDPVFERNPILLLMLGICSALAVTTRLETALAMSLSATAVMVGSSVVLAVIRRQVPDTIRIFVQISIIATLVIVVDQLLQAFFWEISKQLSVFVSLIVTNCIVMGRTEGFALHHRPGLAALDALGHGLGYSAVLMSVAFVRELFGRGELFGIAVLPLAGEGGWYVPMGLMSRAPVAFLLIAFLIWGVRAWKRDPLEGRAED